ncbi:inhibitor of the pro-sigma K processing machinery [Melghiribacillus thermohalophilus]|uniref:Inhibitor of the pro-sigma K processing machinery n=1 Tax=Melghiribacillus thermohalophilus TaxID=1324956 RepID=A0A4V2V2D7_9BACI|nr:pro-sigmaK processing inhibitor BofA family protein [Melghiribacillus thermohalophilus]TCT24662.1 inhibitor of the pro-sigma K processing machinery [Melghiribacillus thermohalophilus]
MDAYLIIGVILGVILLLFVVGVPTKIFKYLSQGVIKIVIGALLLFFLNVFGANFGIHVPINLFTTLITGFLGLPGLASLVAIHMIVFP